MVHHFTAEHYTVFTILVSFCECSLCVSVCNSHLVNFVPLHPPAVTVAPSVTLHCACCPVGTAFIQHDRTSLCSSFPLIVTLFYLVLLILSSSSCLYPHIATLCSLYFLLPSIHPFLFVALSGYCSAKHCLVGRRTLLHQQIVLGDDHKDRSRTYQGGGLFGFKLASQCRDRRK